VENGIGTTPLLAPHDDPVEDHGGSPPAVVAEGQGIPEGLRESQDAVRRLTVRLLATRQDAALEAVRIMAGPEAEELNCRVVVGDALPQAERRAVGPTAETGRPWVAVAVAGVVVRAYVDLDERGEPVSPARLYVRLRRVSSPEELALRLTEVLRAQEYQASHPLLARFLGCNDLARRPGNSPSAQTC